VCFEFLDWSPKLREPLCRAPDSHAGDAHGRSNDVAALVIRRGRFKLRNPRLQYTLTLTFLTQIFPRSLSESLSQKLAKAFGSNHSRLYNRGKLLQLKDFIRHIVGVEGSLSESHGPALRRGFTMLAGLNDALKKLV